MSKQLELHGVYETRGGEWTAEVVCVDLGRERNHCLIIYTNKKDGMKKSGHCSLNGCAGNPKFDLIIPEPEPQWRPWKIEEIPLGGMIRKKATDAVSLIIAINPESKTQIATAGMYLSAELAYAKYEYHNGTSWQPCGVLVS